MKSFLGPKSLLILVILFFIAKGFGQSIENVYYYIDDSKGLSLEDVLALSHDGQFEKLEDQGVINPFNTEDIWFKFIGESSSFQDKFLISDNAFLDTLIVFYPNGITFLSDTTGLRQSINKRDIKISKLAFSLAKVEGDTFYVKSQSDVISSPMLSLQYKEDVLIKEGKKKTLYINSAILLLVFSILSTVLYVVLRRRIFLFYTIHVLSTIFNFLAFNLYFFIWFIPEKTFVQSWVFLFALSSFVLSNLLFSYEALSIRSYSQWLHKSYIFMAIYWFGIILISLISGRHVSAILVLLSANLVLLFNMIAGFIVWRKFQHVQGIIFGIGWLIYFVFAWVYQLMITGKIPNNFFTENITMFGIYVEHLAGVVISILFFLSITKENQAYKSKIDLFATTKKEIDPALFEKYKTLSPRESEVLDLLGKGLLDKEIASELNISIHTIRTYINRIFKKIGVNNRTEAALFQNNFV